MRLPVKFEFNWLLERFIKMSNPWEEIELSDYENHMSLDSVKQLQSMNLTMKKQFNKYDVHSVMVLGIAGGNGLEHISKEKYYKVYGVDINESYLMTVADRYSELSDVLECLRVDIINEPDKLPTSDMVIANLFVEYVGYDAFSKAITKVNPLYVSCVIQINESTKQWVSDSPYLHAFDGLNSVHCQMEENALSDAMCKIGYKLVGKESDSLPNGKSLVRLDYEVCK